MSRPRTARQTIGLKATHELKRLDNLPNLKVGGIAPEIDGNDLEGNRMKLSDYRGKVVMVVFWGSWCGPCMAMVPPGEGALAAPPGQAIRPARRQLRRQAGGGEEDRRPTRGWAGRPGMTGRRFAVPSRRIMTCRIGRGSYLIDAKGVIRSIDAHGKELDEAVEKLLAELE